MKSTYTYRSKHTNQYSEEGKIAQYKKIKKALNGIYVLLLIVKRYFIFKQIFLFTSMSKSNC